MIPNWLTSAKTKYTSLSRCRSLRTINNWGNHGTIGSITINSRKDTITARSHCRSAYSTEFRSMPANYWELILDLVAESYDGYYDYDDYYDGDEVNSELIKK
jgi:hypothetical protein